MKSIVDTIYNAQKGAYEIEKVTDTYGNFDIQDAYAYQKQLLNRLVSEGGVVSGYKMGLTSKEKMAQMNIDSPIHGELLEEWDIKDTKLWYARLIHPKAEPEVAFIMKDDVKLDATDEELKKAIGWIAPAIEVVDSRFKDFKSTLPDAIADNCAAAAYSIGKLVEYPLDGIDLKNIKISIVINGEVKAEGMSSAILEDPFESLKALHISLAKEGVQLKKGQVVLAGAVTDAFSIYPGDKVANITDSIGSAEFEVEQVSQ